MDRLSEFLDVVKQHADSEDAFLGLLHILIGRRVTQADGTVVSVGLTWRAAAALLKKVRWDKEAVRQLGLDPQALPPRDRDRYWYATITQAGVDSDTAVRAADKLARKLRKDGYDVGPAPGRGDEHSH